MLRRCYAAKRSGRSVAFPSSRAKYRFASQILGFCPRSGSSSLADRFSAHKRQGAREISRAPVVWIIPMCAPSVAQAGAALRAAAGQNLAAVGGGHALAEAVDLGALALLGLIGTNHAGTPPVIMWRNAPPGAPPSTTPGNGRGWLLEYAQNCASKNGEEARKGYFTTRFYRLHAFRLLLSASPSPNDAEKIWPVVQNLRLRISFFLPIKYSLFVIICQLYFLKRNGKSLDIPNLG